MMEIAIFPTATISAMTSEFHIIMPTGTLPAASMPEPSTVA